MQKMEVFLGTIIDDNTDSRRCFDCLNFDGEYSVSDKVWLQAWPYARDHQRLMKRRALQLGLDPKIVVRQRLCFTCLEARLGRKLTIDDFQLVPINAGIRFGFQLGSEPPTRG